MTVRELIEHLQAADPEREVLARAEERGRGPVVDVQMPYVGPVTLVVGDGYGESQRH